jgi:hypothetical protein
VFVPKQSFMGMLILENTVEGQILKDFELKKWNLK